MANNPYIQTNFTASDMLGNKKTEPVKAKKPAPKPARPAPVVEVKEETTASVETVVEEVAVEEVAVEELTKSDEE
jgi:hypothetical protein